MKHLVFGSLTLLLLSAVSAPAWAIRSPRSIATRPIAIGSGPSYATQVTPFGLVYLARHGYFREQGIPGYGSLMAAYESGDVTAEELVQAAIDTNRLSVDVLDDSGFMDAVANQLRLVNAGH